MGRLSLRARMIGAFVAVAAIATLVASLLTARGVNTSFDRFQERRTAYAAQSAVALAQESHAAAGGSWSQAGLDRLAHELVLSGYDFRLRVDGRILLDTTRLGQPGTPLRLLAREPVLSGGRTVGQLELFGLVGAGGTPADADLRHELDRQHLVAAAIAALVAIAAGLVMAGRLSGPMRRLAEAARALGRDGAAAVPLAAGSPPEVRALAQGLEALAGDLERQRRSRRQLAQDLAHELRTPLMLMQARIEAMQDGVLTLGAEELELLHTEVRRLARLIGQIERLAEAEAAPRPLRPQPLALEEIARELHAGLVAAFELRGIAFALDARPAHALADPDAVRQIGANLLSNALKYAPEGGAVTLLSALEGRWALLRVSDSGPGIDERAGASVFSRFYRGPEAAGTSGEGLGLTIAAELAHGQGGELVLERGAPGTSFALRLPLHRPALTRPANAPLLGPRRLERSSGLAPRDGEGERALRGPSSDGPGEAASAAPSPQVAGEADAGPARAPGNGPRSQAGSA